MKSTFRQVIAVAALGLSFTTNAAARCESEAFSALVNDYILRGEVMSAAAKAESTDQFLTAYGAVLNWHQNYPQRAMLMERVRLTCGDLEIARDDASLMGWAQEQWQALAALHRYATTDMATIRQKIATFSSDQDFRNRYSELLRSKGVGGRGLNER